MNNSNTLLTGFCNFFLSPTEKGINKINNEAQEAGKQISADLFLDKVSQYGFELDKEQPEQLKQFLHAINSVMQLKLTGVHTVTLYNQRLELHFDNDSTLTSIKLI